MSDYIRTQYANRKISEILQSYSSDNSVKFDDQEIASFCRNSQSTQANYKCRNGLCLIFHNRKFNIYNEKGQKLRNRVHNFSDALRLHYIFEENGFSVHSFDNLDVDSIKRELNEYSSGKRGVYDLLVCVVLTHLFDGKLCAQDAVYPFNIIHEPFLLKNCKMLKGKPKLFICDFSQAISKALGKKQQFKVPAELPTEDDFFVAISLASDDAIIRSPYIEYSHFMRFLIEAMQDNKGDIELIFNDVKRRLSIEQGDLLLQHTLVFTTLRDNCYINRSTVQLTKEQLEDEYKFKNGHCVIFNHDTYNIEGEINPPTREGAEKDCKDIRKHFIQCGFKVLILNNPTYEDIITILTCYAKDIIDHDCLVCFFLTHGKMNKLYAKDKSYEIDNILIPFIPEEATRQAEKAIVFFINACQTYFEFDGNPLIARLDKKILRQMCIPESDFLIAMSTAPGFTSLRNIEDGAFFIQYLLQTLRSIHQNNEKQDIHKVLQRTYNTFSKDRNDFKGMFVHLAAENSTNEEIRQYPVYVSTMRKLFDLHRNVPH